MILWSYSHWKASINGGSICVPSEMWKMGTHRQQRKCNNKNVLQQHRVSFNVIKIYHLSRVPIRNVMPCRWHCKCTFTSPKKLLCGIVHQFRKKNIVNLPLSLYRSDFLYGPCSGLDLFIFRYFLFIRFRNYFFFALGFQNEECTSAAVFIFFVYFALIKFYEISCKKPVFAYTQQLLVSYLFP